VGVEVNPAAVECARKNGIEVFTRVADVPDEYVDVIISNSALEHTLQPLEELKSLYRKLQAGGRSSCRASPSRTVISPTTSTITSTAGVR
jgi:hypothetical protein